MLTLHGPSHGFDATRRPILFVVLGSWEKPGIVTQFSVSMLLSPGSYLAVKSLLVWRVESIQGLIAMIHVQGMQGKGFTFHGLPKQRINAAQ
jgi:hypothetical protein